jgi:hypothetical protein
MNSLQEKIRDCTHIQSEIEKMEFSLIEHNLHSCLKLSRLIKRSLIIKQTEYWNELHGPKILTIKNLKRKKK